MYHFSSLSIGVFPSFSALSGVRLLVGLVYFLYIGIKGPTDYLC